VIFRGAKVLLLLRGDDEDADYRGDDGALLVQPQE
jgi:hypothetical protein